MNIVEFDISECNDDFPILTFLNEVNGRVLNWKISYLYCVGDNETDIDILSLENKINNSTNGLYISGEELFKLLTNIHQVYDITMCAMDKNKELFVLDIIDSGIISLKYKDSQFVDQLSKVVSLMN